MKLVLDESGIGTKVVLDKIFTFGMKVVLDELVFYRQDSSLDREQLSVLPGVFPLLLRSSLLSSVRECPCVRFFRSNVRFVLGT